MISTSARLLRLVALLAARPSWTCGELAERMAVTERTVRRDVARLRELGYGVESEPGPWGGYRLSGGTQVLPLILDDEEALAVAVALRDAARSGVLGGDQEALSALLKLRQALPPRIADRLAEMDAAFVHTPRAGERQIAPGMLLELAMACRRGERTRLSYRDREGKATVREVDPYRLVHTGRRWYFVARDVAQAQWRTFRADRVAQARPTGRTVELVDPPDPALLVTRGIAGGGYEHHVTVRLPVPLDRALRLVPPTVGTHHPDGPDATVVRIGGRDADGLARYLLSLAIPLRVLAPDDVRQALLRRGQELVAENGDRSAGPATVPGGCDRALTSCGRTGEATVGETAVRRYYELVDQGDVDGLVALFDPAAVYHRPGYPPLRGTDELLRFYTSQRVIKEGRHTLTTLVADGDQVAVHGEFRGTLHSGETVETRFADFFRCDPDGRFTRRDTFFFVPRV